MSSQRFRLVVSAVLLASSAGAQVLAGVTGALSGWQALWLLVTVMAAGSGTVLGAGGAPSQKKPVSAKTLVFDHA